VLARSVRLWGLSSVRLWDYERFMSIGGRWGGTGACHRVFRSTYHGAQIQLTSSYRRVESCVEACSLSRVSIALHEVTKKLATELTE